MKTKFNLSVLWAVLAAALYALNSPVSKLLLESVTPTMMAAFLYLGAGLGMAALGLVRKAVEKAPRERHLSRKDLPYTIGMVVLDIAAPIFLMTGLARTAPANVSLLNNFEIVATSLIALVIFKEAVSRRLWLAIGLITLASVVLSMEDAGSPQFSSGSVFVLLACVCWGFENNCTRMISSKSTYEIVVLKGVFSGSGSLATATPRRSWSVRRARSTSDRRRAGAAAARAIPARDGGRARQFVHWRPRAAGRSL